MSETKHTPLPWAIKYDFNLYGPDRYYAGSDRLVANTGGHQNSVHAAAVHEENLSNAAFIKHACESHEDLLEALRGIAKGEGPFSRDPLTHASNTIEAMKALARAAIHKAEADRE